MINTWINAFIKPKETFAKEKANASLSKGFLYYLIAGLISAVILFLAVSFFPAIYSVYGAQSSSIFTVIMIRTVLIVFNIITIGMFFAIAKLLGGKGSFTSLFYLASLYAVPIALISWIPYLVVLAILYAYYLLYLAVKESQELAGGKAVAVTLISIILVILLGFIIGLPAIIAKASSI